MWKEKLWKTKPSIFRRVYLWKTEKTFHYFLHRKKPVISRAFPTFPQRRAVIIKYNKKNKFFLSVCLKNMIDIGEAP